MFVWERGSRSDLWIPMAMGVRMCSERKEAKTWAFLEEPFVGSMLICKGGLGLGPPVAPFYPFFRGGFPYFSRLQRRRYPYANLSTGGPSGSSVFLFFVVV